MTSFEEFMHSKLKKLPEKKLLYTKEVLDQRRNLNFKISYL